MEDQLDEFVVLEDAGQAIDDLMRRYEGDRLEPRDLSDIRHGLETIEQYFLGPMFEIVVDVNPPTELLIHICKRQPPDDRPFAERIGF